MHEGPPALSAPTPRAAEISKGQALFQMVFAPRLPVMLSSVLWEKFAAPRFVPQVLERNQSFIPR
jgi:hypothetical protein